MSKEKAPSKNLSVVTISVLLFFYFLTLAPLFSQELNSNLYSQLKYRFIGPVGNRVISVSGIPGNPNIYYIGAASGGIFKSADAGETWEPIFDSQPVSSIGSLAIAPSDPNIIWAGTGETFIRSNISQGMGIYKSTDAGKNWQCMGLEKTGRIGRVVIDPKDPDIVFAAAMGHCYGPQQERGVFRTKDGGTTWERVLFIDENTGCSDMAMDPNNSQILFAGMWPMFIRTWGRWSGGPGGGIYISRDGGTTWKKLTKGLPETPIGKVAVAVAASNSNRVYALIEAADEGLWRSDDGGETWRHVNHDHMLCNRPHYYTRCTVSTNNDNEIYSIAGTTGISLDGGETFKRFPLGRFPSGVDNHDMWIDPLDADRMMISNDNGVQISVNRGKTWNIIRLPIAQMYHATVDDQIPYFVYGNRQDGPSFYGPSNSLTGGKIPASLWESIGGGESGWGVPDPVDPNIVWSGSTDGKLDRTDLRTGHHRSVTVWPESIQCWPAKDVKYRFNWTFPIAISPHDHNKVYVGSQHVHMTADGGQSWTAISPDLTTNDKTKQERTGGLTPDDAIPIYGCVLFAIAESPLEKGLIWAGSNDGLVHVTRDGGSNWTNVTANITGLPQWGTISNIEPSKHEAGTCYISADLHQVNIRDPYIYKTADYGKTWKLISTGIPKSELSYVHCVREDPVRKGMLYAGTENALYISFNEGAAWIPLQSDLPHAPVHWLTLQGHFNDLVVSTYGRGFWIMDDVTPLQQLTQDVLKSDSYLFSPRAAYRFLDKASAWAFTSEPNDTSAGNNPPYGASINYYLKTESKQEPKIDILDDQGQLVRSLKGSKNAGINRLWWDLRHERTREAKLRTSPVGHPHVTVGSEGWRPLGRGGALGPLAVPGIYAVKLIIDGKELTQKLTIRKDPRSAGTQADIQSQVTASLEIRDNINQLVDMIHQIEWVRKQVEDLKAILGEDNNARILVAAGEEMIKKFIDLEDQLFPVGFTGAYDRDGLRWADKLYEKLSYLVNDIYQTDFPLTAQQAEVQEELKRQTTTFQNQLDELINKDLAAFNSLLKEKNIPNIIVSKTP